MVLNYAEDSKIDVNALDIEFINIPKIEERYIRQVADLKKDYIKSVELEKLAHEQLKTVRSKLTTKAHNNAEELFGKSKATGPEVEAYYRTHKKYIRAKKLWIAAESEVIESESALELAKDMKDLIHFTKTKALEQLVTLHGQGYFAGPNVPRNINRELERRETKEKRHKKTSKKIGKNLRRKK